jgi:hypothetical protein
MNDASRRVWPKYVGYGILLYVVFLAATIPAAWLGYALERSGAAKVRLLEPSGTVWRGEGVLVPAGPSAAPPPPRIRWELSPLWLFAGRARVTIDSADKDASLRARLTLARGALTITELEAALPARLAGAFYARAGFFGPEGTLRLRADDIELREGWLSGEASAIWERAELRGMGMRPAGTYRLVAKATGQRADFKLATVEGDLRVAGDGDWDLARGGLLRFKGTAALAAARSDLEPLLPMLGRERGDGEREFSVAWPLALPRLR